MLYPEGFFFSDGMVRLSLLETREPGFLVLGCVFAPQILSTLRKIISREAGREIVKF